MGCLVVGPFQMLELLGNEGVKNAPNTLEQVAIVATFVTSIYTINN